MPRKESESLTFIDVDTGMRCQVLAAKATVDAAYKLGLLPASDDDMVRSDEVMMDG